MGQGTRTSFSPATLGPLARFTPVHVVEMALASEGRGLNAPLTRGSLNAAHLLL